MFAAFGFAVLFGALTINWHIIATMESWPWFVDIGLVVYGGALTSMALGMALEDAWRRLR